MPYNPGWQGQLQQYAQAQQNPYSYHSQGYATPQYQQQMQYQQNAQQGASKVDGPAEAMNRFLMQYPAQSLVPGFVSWPPLFDVNGRQFYTLSIEPDGRRNLETFDYAPHSQAQQVVIDGVTFASRDELDEFCAKVSIANSMIGRQNGVLGPVPAATATVPTAGTASAAQGADGAATLPHAG